LLTRPIRRLSPAQIRTKLWRHRVLRQALDATGLHAWLDVATRPGKRVELTRHAVPAPLPAPVTVALVADLHLNGVDREAHEMLAMLERERPDLIVIAGDLTSDDGSEAVYADMLSRLRAPRGVWMVPGNWDYWLPTADLGALCSGAGVRLLSNQSAEIAPGLWLAGVDDAVSGEPDPARALASIPAGAWVMALIHCPVTFDDVAGRCALAFAGHTHGGQVRIPGLPPLWLPAGCGRYVAGWYERNGSRLYVSRGIGAKTLPIRLWCRPELALFTLGGPQTAAARRCPRAPAGGA
jgi:predicted MPP superfamily phosphohydrolase